MNSNQFQWARSAKMFDPERSHIRLDELENLPAEDLGLEWSKWARREEMER